MPRAIFSTSRSGFQRSAYDLRRQTVRCGGNGSPACALAVGRLRRKLLLVRAGLLVILAVAFCAVGIKASYAGLPAARSAVTQHVGTFNGTTIHYTAWVEDNFVSAPSGRSGASVITVAYTRDGVKNVGARPVIFAFNGGPGAASAILNFTAIGPVRLVGRKDGERDSGQFESSPDSVLDMADLVFIDPVSTGFSRAFPGVASKYWYSGKTDALSVAHAIKHWLKVHHRGDSPLYLLGESYGTWRVGFLLQDSEGLSFDGIILIGLFVPTTGGVIPYVTSLPTMAAGAWYHKQIDRNGRSVEEVFHDAARFAVTDYVTALMQGASLPSKARKETAEKMARLIGLPVGLILKHHLRISKNTYMFNLLKNPHKRTGQLDVRVVGELGPNE